MSKTLQDINNNGHIMYTEFLAATLEAHGYIEEERVANAFDRLDSDDSGKTVLVCLASEVARGKFMVIFFLFLIFLPLNLQDLFRETTCVRFWEKIAQNQISPTL